MPTRKPNALYGAARSAAVGRGTSEIVYIETDPDSDCSAGRAEGVVPESLQLAQQEIWRLQDAVKTLESCLQSRAPNTSAAWKEEAEKSQTEAKRHKKENKMLVEELTAVKNALASQASERKLRVDEAVALESQRWEKRLESAGQEAEDLRGELQQTLTRFEELEMSKTKALFELTEERSRVYPKGVDPEVHQSALHELSATKSRLKEEEARSSELTERVKREAASAQAEATQASNYLKRIVKESRTELTELRDQAAENWSTIASLTAQNKLLQSKVETLQAEGMKRSEIQQQWADWSHQVSEAVRKELSQGVSVTADFEDMHRKLAEVEARVTKTAGDVQQRMRQLAAHMPQSI